MYFLCMKTKDSADKDFHLITKESKDILSLVNDSEEMTRLLSSEILYNPPSRSARIVIDNNFKQITMAQAIESIHLNAINDFEWHFHDKYGRKVFCYITSNF